MRRWLLPLCLALLPLAAPAQDAAQTEADKGFLTRFLEDNLSGAGRTVRIDGFAGALSSRATFTRLTIADDQGIWITIRDGAISWNRGALLSGAVEVNELSAAEIDLPRAPGSTASGMPSPVARTFSLPELPVSVSIGRIRAGRVTLGAALLGTAATVSLDGAMQLAGGQGEAKVDIQRIDGPEGTLQLTAAYANDSRQLTLDLLAREGPAGIAASLLGIPGQPAMQLAINGRAPIDTFRADVALSSDGQPRLAGQVTLSSGAEGARQFVADLSGDIAPLLLPDYQDFFGSDLRLAAKGQRQPDGAVLIDKIAIDSTGVDLTGSLDLDPRGLPRMASLDIRLGVPGVAETLLPLAGTPTFVKAGRLQLGFDAARSDDWTLGGQLQGFRKDGTRIETLDLDGSGTIVSGTSPSASGSLRFQAVGIVLDDPALALAVGPSITAGVTFDWSEGRPLSLAPFSVTAAGLSASGEAAVSGPGSALGVSGRVTAQVQDMSRLSGLAGRSVGGAAAIDLVGTGALLTGAFDVEATISGRDMTVSQSQIDNLLRGAATVAASARRDTTGTEIRSLRISAGTLSATASGWIRDTTADLTARLDFRDLSHLGGGLRGALSADASVTRQGGVTRAKLDGSGEGLGVGQPEIDRVLAGTAELSLLAEEEAGRLRIESFTLRNPQVRVSATGRSEADTRTIDLEARLTDLALLAPGFSGPVAASGRITERGGLYRVDVDANGPAGISARTTGDYDLAAGRADLAIAGQGQLAALSPFLAPRSISGPVQFDLTVKGPPSLESVGGRVQATGVRFVDPAMRITLDSADMSATLDRGTAQVSGKATVRGGGQVSVSGPIRLQPPHDGDLTVVLQAARLRDASLYDTRLDGTLSVRGPLLGGALISGQLGLAATELRVPSAGLGVNDIALPITHVHEPADVRATRARAGLVGPDATGPSAARRSYELDLLVSAPNRIFVRGRGLDAEMGGSLRLTGTTDNVVPSGQFSLIRGRLDILGKRFVIDEGRVELQGALIPWVRFAATTEADGVASTIAIEGQANQPKITFTSQPEQPEEEVLARLLFGHGLSSLSIFQAAQLASAVATLTGRGGDGILGRLRTSFGLDDLDVTTGTDGNAALRFGKYLNENIYTDVELGQNGQSEIRLNLDVAPNVTAKGSLGSDGTTGIGIYYERDY